jgi:hypothetical protein
MRVTLTPRSGVIGSNSRRRSRSLNRGFVARRYTDCKFSS